MTNEELDRLEALAEGATRFGTDGREDADDGSIEWQSMSETTFATYERKADRDWYRDAPDVVLRLVAEIRKARGASACDACCGTGEPISGLPCMCSGSGLASEAVNHLRSALFASERRADRLADELSEARAEVERLRALAPPDSVACVLRSAKNGHEHDRRYAFGSIDDQAELYDEAMTWLARIESAKGAGR